MVRRTTYQPGSSRGRGANAVGELHSRLRATIDWTKPAQDMDVTERMYYLRGRGYGISTVGCIELSTLLKQREKEEITAGDMRRAFKDLVLTLESMIAQKIDVKREVERAKTEEK